MEYSVNPVGAGASQVHFGNVQKTVVKKPNVITQAKQSVDEFKRWYNDNECTDGKNDGSIGAKEFALEYTKGLTCGIVDAAVEHPIATGLTIAAGAGLTILTGGAILPVLAGVGLASGGIAIAKGTYNAMTAETDGDKKAAAREMGTGTATMVLSALGTKKALQTANAAGVESAAGAENMNILQSSVQCFKSAPEALKVSAVNAKGNFLTYTTGVVHAGSNKLQGGEAGMSKATTADVKRLDLSGTQEEVLARYQDSGMFVKDGKYYVPNKWSETEPYLVKDGNVLMKYGADDFAICDKGVFEKSYGTTESFNAGKFQYSKVDSLASDSYVNATKQAPARAVTLPEGTKVQTLEGQRTVQAGEVVAIDVEGNPYVQPLDKFQSKNIITGTLTPANLKQGAVVSGIHTIAADNGINEILK